MTPGMAAPAASLAVTAKRITSPWRTLGAAGSIVTDTGTAVVTATVVVPRTAPAVAVSVARPGSLGLEQAVPAHPRDGRRRAGPGHRVVPLVTGGAQRLGPQLDPLSGHQAGRMRRDGDARGGSGEHPNGHLLNDRLGALDDRRGDDFHCAPRARAEHPVLVHRGALKTLLPESDFRVGYRVAARVERLRGEAERVADHDLGSGRRDHEARHGRLLGGEGEHRRCHERREGQHRPHECHSVW